MDSYFFTHPWGATGRVELPVATFLITERTHDNLPTNGLITDLFTAEDNTNPFCEPRHMLLCLWNVREQFIIYYKRCILSAATRDTIAGIKMNRLLFSVFSFLVLSSPPDVFIKGGQTIDETEQTNNCGIGEHLCVETQPSEVDADLLSIVLPVVQETH